MDSLTVSTATVGQPVTLDEAKEHLDIDYTEHDTLITTFIAAATEEVERTINRDLMQRSYQWKIAAWPFPFYLPRGPVISIDSITYTDPDEVSATVATTVYGLRTTEPAEIYIKDGQTLPSVLNQADVITVTFTTGYAGSGDSPIDRSAIPDALRSAIMLRVFDLYQNRGGQITGTMVTQNETVWRLLQPYRTWQP